MSLTEVQPGLVRKYFYEYVLMALCGCIVYLFLSFNSLNAFIRTELMQQRTDVIKAVEQNTNVINDFLNYQREQLKKK